jgi:hypothetical protein
MTRPVFLLHLLLLLLACTCWAAWLWSPSVLLDVLLCTRLYG